MACTHGQRRKGRQKKQEGAHPFFFLLSNALLQCEDVSGEKDRETGILVFLTSFSFSFLYLLLYIFCFCFCWTFFSSNVFQLPHLIILSLMHHQEPMERYRRESHSDLRALSVSPTSQPSTCFLFCLQLSATNPQCTHNLMHSRAIFIRHCHDMLHTSKSAQC